MKRLIGVLKVDAGITFEEYARIISAFLKEDFHLEINKETSNIIPHWSTWMVVLSKID